MTALQATKRATKAQKAALEASMRPDPWTCRGCGKENPAEDPACRAGCRTGFRKDLLYTERQLLAAIAATEGRYSFWKSLHDRKATDEEIHDGIGIILNLTAGSVESDAGPISWTFTNRRASFWCDSKDGPASGVGPDWQGEILAQQVRDLFLIEPPPGAAKPRPKKGKDPEAGSLDLRDDEPASIELDVPVDKIEPSPLNPRIHFGPVELEQLGQSLKTHGQLQNVVLWVKDDGRYELVDGERLWRAAKHAGVATLRAKVLRISEQKAIELRGIANVQREDMSALEIARWYQQLLERCGYTQQALADKLGCTQATISNRLRLLRLPEDWQKRIIARGISEAHARELVTWCDLPAVLAELAKNLDREEDGPPAVKEWQGWIREALITHSRPVRAGERFYKPVAKDRVQSTEVILTTAEIAAGDLDEREVPAGRGYPAERRAFNVARYDELHDAKAKERKKEAKAEREQLAGTTAAATSASSGKAMKASEPTPEELAAAEKARRERAEQELDRAYQEHLDLWTREAIAERIRQPKKVPSTLLMRLMICFTFTGPDWWDRIASIREAHKAVKAPKPKKAAVADVVNVGLIGLVESVPNVDQFARWAAAMWVDGIEYEELPHIARLCGIDFAAEWQVSERFIELHNPEQLAALAKEWKLSFGVNTVRWETASDAERQQATSDFLAAAEKKRVKPTKRLLKLWKEW